MPQLRLSTCHPEAHCSKLHSEIGDPLKWAHSSSFRHAHTEGKLAISRFAYVSGPLNPHASTSTQHPSAAFITATGVKRPHQIHHLCHAADCCLQSVALAAFRLRSTLHLDVCLYHTHLQVRKRHVYQLVCSVLNSHLYCDHHSKAMPLAHDCLDSTAIAGCSWCFQPICARLPGHCKHHCQPPSGRLQG